MDIFRDEYDEIIAWRVALAALIAVAIAAAVALMVFGPKPQEEKEEEHVELPTPTVSVQQQQSDLDAWLEGIEGSELLADLPDEDVRAIMEAAESFSEEESVVSVPAAPHTDGEALVAYLRIETDGRALYLTLRHEGNAPWEVHELTETVVGVNDQDETPVAVSDTKELAKVMPDAVAYEVSRQFLASGIANANRAWTMRKGTSTTEGVTNFRIYVPGDGADTTIYDASFEESFGMLEIAPQAEPTPREVG